MTTPAEKDIFHATKKNDLTAVQYFIEQKNVPVTSTDSDGRSIPLVAAEFNHLPILKYILEKNSTLLSIGDKSGNTILQRAIQKGNLEMVKFLVDECQADILTPEHRINTAIHVAAQEGQLEILKYFIKGKNGDVNVNNENGETPIFTAAEKPYLHIITYLLDECEADPTITDLYGDNILFKSAYRGDITVPKYLLDERKIHFDINWRNTKGYTVVNWASKFSHLNFVKYMVDEKNADVNIADTINGRTPLHNAAYRNNYDLCKYLIEHGAEPEVKDVHGYAPIQLADEPKVAKYLYSHVTNRRRRSVIKSELPTSVSYELNRDSQQLRELLASEKGSFTHASTSKFDTNNFLIAVDIIVQYATGLGYQRVENEALMSPKEIIKRRIDPIAMDAIKSVPEC